MKYVTPIVCKAKQLKNLLLFLIALPIHIFISSWGIRPLRPQETKQTTGGNIKCKEKTQQNGNQSLSTLNIVFLPRKPKKVSSMIIVTRKGVTKQELDHIVKHIEDIGCKPHLSEGIERTIIGVIGDERQIDPAQLSALPAVEKVMPVMKPYQLVSREFQPEDTIVKVGDIKIGGKELVVMAGPCAVENEEQILAIAHEAKKAGAQMLRGGAFKPRTGPYDFQGLKEDGLKMLAKARDETGLLIVTEVMAPSQVELVARYADMLQIGTRNMQNFDLLKAVGKSKKPVLLKRGMSATYKEWLLAAEYIASEGNPNIVLCERGIRTFETHTRNTLDLAAVPAIKLLSHLPIVVDPSHGTGKKALVHKMALAAIAAGADGLIVEAHVTPEKALTDADQTISMDELTALLDDIKKLAPVVNRKL